ncbi:MAG: hypothetical protein ABEL76_17060 [Bradymonadaceae bacterium]
MCLAQIVLSDAPSPTVVLIAVGVGIVLVGAFVVYELRSGTAFQSRQEYYDDALSEFDDECFVCGANRDGSAAGPCPDCGFDRTEPGDPAITDAVVQLEQLEEIEGALQRRREILPDARDGFVGERLAELGRLDVVDASELPASPDDSPDWLNARDERRKAIEDCFGEIGAARSRLREQIRARLEGSAPNAADDT